MQDRINLLREEAFRKDLFTNIIGFTFTVVVLMIDVRAIYGKKL